MSKLRNALSEDEIIAQARKAFGAENEAPFALVDALEAFYMNGCADDQDGDTDTFGHFYRVHRWIVWTDGQGFHYVETHDTEEEAIKAFRQSQEEYDDLLVSGGE